MDAVIVIATSELTDNEIIERILVGEKKLYERIIRKYNPRLYRVGIAIVKEDSIVEDLMQNAYVRAYEHLPRFEHRAAFGTWLTRIMINECLQFVKKRKHATAFERQKRYNMNNYEEKTPDKVAINRELAQVLENALFELPEKYRLVFVMREMEDMSIAETTEALSLSESNVKVRLNRAKSMLREKLNEYYKSNQIFHFYLTRCDRVVANVNRALSIK
jgi:RNA polymerase sigma-70 factor (ECF subfamily)